VQKNLLFIPGPVTVADAVLTAMAQPLMDHRSAPFATILKRIESRMRPIFGTRNDVLILSSSGTGGLETAVANMFGPDDTVLVCPIGVFGQRFIDLAKTYGCKLEVLETPWGGVVDPAALRARLTADTGKKITGILLTQNETSTGAQNDMAALAAVTREHGAYVVVDAVSGLGASEFRMDDWGFDVVVTASQKAIAAPPGIAMVAVSPRAWKKIERNDSPRFYFDLQRAREFSATGETPWTPAISIAYALDVALDLFEKEGDTNVWRRHDRYARAIRAAVQALGLTLYSHDGAHSPTVVAAYVPKGVDGDAIRQRLREERGLMIGGGQKDLKGKIIRIGTMGDLSQTDILGMIGALELALLEAGHQVQLGAGGKAALAIFLAESAVVPA
jgi:aspartate aminotransferase-like enzyme